MITDDWWLMIDDLGLMTDDPDGDDDDGDGDDDDDDDDVDIGRCIHTI